MFHFVNNLQSLLPCWRGKENDGLEMLSIPLLSYLMFLISEQSGEYLSSKLFSQVFLSFNLVAEYFCLCAKHAEGKTHFGALPQQRHACVQNYSAKHLLFLNLVRFFKFITITSSQYSKTSVILGGCLWDGKQFLSTCSAYEVNSELNSVNKKVLFPHTLYKSNFNFINFPKWDGWFWTLSWPGAGDCSYPKCRSVHTTWFIKTQIGIPISFVLPHLTSLSTCKASVGMFLVLVTEHRTKAHHTTSVLPSGMWRRQNLTRSNHWMFKLKVPVLREALEEELSEVGIRASAHHPAARWIELV